MIHTAATHQGFSRHYICIYNAEIYITCLWHQRINGREALIGEWEELNKETYVCNVCYKTTSRCTSARNSKVINLQRKGKI